MSKQINPVVSLDQFAQLMGAWFFQKSQQIDQLIEFPEHEGIRVVDNNTGEEHVLTGPERSAFIEGLKVARTIFDVLPFTSVPVDADGQPVLEDPEAVAPTGEPANG